MNALNLIQFESSLVFADAPAAGMSVGAIIGIIIGAVILLIFFFSFFPVGLAISAGASGVHVGLFQLEVYKEGAGRADHGKAIDQGNKGRS